MRAVNPSEVAKGKATLAHLLCFHALCPCLLCARYLSGEDPVLGSRLGVPLTEFLYDPRFYLSGPVLVLVAIAQFPLIIGLTYGAWEHFDRSFDCARPWCSRDSSIDIKLPIWPSKLVVPIAFAILTLRLLLQAWGYGRALVLGLENPVAVPLALSIEAQAMAEAKLLEGAD